MRRIQLDVFDRFNDRGSDNGGKGFAVNFNVSINLKGTNPKIIYLDSGSFLLFLLPPLAL